MNKQRLLELNAIADGSMVSFTGEPELIESPNGDPLGIDVSHTHYAELTGISITSAEVKAAGLTHEDIPNVNIIEFGE